MSSPEMTAFHHGLRRRPGRPGRGLAADSPPDLGALRGIILPHPSRPPRTSRIGERLELDAARRVLLLRPPRTSRIRGSHRLGRSQTRHRVERRSGNRASGTGSLSDGRGRGSVIRHAVPGAAGALPVAVVEASSRTALVTGVGGTNDRRRSGGPAPRRVVGMPAVTRRAADGNARQRGGRGRCRSRGRKERVHGSLERPTHAD